MPPIDEQTKSDSTNDSNFELESQFILRLPSLPAASLRAAIKSGVLNLKDRLSIQIEQDMRNGVVRFDGWVLPSKIVDLPTIMESLKTLDNKNFYKTADISQLMICKEEADDINNKDDNDEIVKKTKDGKDKKYLYPHGVTKPLKNVRKRRFRKTLRKKYVDFPEIEKEVKRLLRQDNEAKNVRFEIVQIEDETNKSENNVKDTTNNSNSNSNTNTDTNTDNTNNNINNNSTLDDRDLFGDIVSSSSDDDDDDDGVNINNNTNDNVIGTYSDEGSRMSTTAATTAPLTSATTFRDYLRDQNVDDDKNLSFSQAFSQQSSSSNQATPNPFEYQPADNSSENETIRLNIQQLEQQIQQLQQQRHLQQTELDGIENFLLKQRFQAIIDDLREQELMKKRELDELKKKF